jgi:membrane-bound PQQ-dependent dehydrogenase (glucose/quinate/shikimate family)
MTAPEPSMTEARTRRPPRLFAVLLLLIAAAFLYGGIKLIAVGGSWYYLIAGIALASSAVLLWRRNPLGSRVYGLLLIATLVWALAEAGTDLWALMPRLAFLSVLGLWLITPFARRGLYSPHTPPPLFGTPLSKGIAIAASLFILVMVGLGSREGVVTQLEPRHVPKIATPPAAPEDSEWRHYGSSARGTRYGAIDQITPENAGKLTKLWHYRTGRPGQFKATPLQVGELLYTCTAMNAIQAIDAETGQKRWEFDPLMKIPPVGFNTTCRGVSYHQAPADYAGVCPTRIIMGTTDARLFAVNALTGERCNDFGDKGEISLLKGIGDAKPNFYLVTSPPLIARNVAVVGTRVADNFEVNEPSGVIRAYDAITGKFVWAWDMGRPGVNTEPAEGEEYTRGTPNVWSMMSYDDQLGLIYAPTGNSTPDFFGAHRSEASEKYSSSVVALDVDDGSVRWSYQTVHHDVWDYDVPSQPTLVDVPQEDGTSIPTLIQPTKRGELFMLDRRSGTPIAEVVEKPVPQGAVEHEWLSKTQPFSVGMPNFRPDLTEADMWGITPFDQMYCRIQFNKLRFEGHFTPPSVEGTLVFPGNAGGFNWGSAAVNEEQKLLVVAPMMLASRLSLIPRAQVPKESKRYLQLGTPYAASIMPFMSPMAVPCTEPPYGRIAVIDLQTRQIVWNRRLGTANESGPLGLKIGLNLPMGVPLAAGPIVTKGGVIFFAGGMDRYLRAIDLKTGKELWREALPGASQATPMTYLSPKTKRQILIVAVPSAQRRFGMDDGGSAAPTDPEGGHLIAYGLPASEDDLVTK